MNVRAVTERVRGQLLRIFIDEDDIYDDQPLYAAIVDALREAGFTGATVLKAIEGFGLDKTVRAVRSLDASAGLPIVVEVIEDEAKIATFLPVLQTMISDGLITLEKIDLIRLSKDAEP